MQNQVAGKITAAVLFVSLLVPVSARAIEWQLYSPEGFGRSQAAGKAILISVHADW